MPDQTLPAAIDWERIAATPEFRALLKDKQRFIIRATLFFLIYYFALPILVGYYPYLMDMHIVGVVNIAYIFALSQFFMAWIVAWIYVRKAAQFDEAAKRIIARSESARD